MHIRMHVQTDTRADRWTDGHANEDGYVDEIDTDRCASTAHGTDTDTSSHAVIHTLAKSHATARTQAHLCEIVAQALTEPQKLDFT